MTLDEDTRLHAMWEVFEDLFSNKWTKDTKMETMHKFQDKLKEAKEEIKKDRELSKVHTLNQTLTKEVHKLKQENISNGKCEKVESREELKKKDE
jgi:hypothetical protein